MDDLFDEIDCKSKSDAIVMRLLRSAMDKAHEKVQSENGPIEFLHERSKFYELAAILVDGSLNIVEEETDIVETSREKMLTDLTEIKDWLQRRIEEMRILIMEKDMELMERVENELKIRHALELNERELVYLRDKLETERTKSEDFQDFIQSSQEIEDEAQGSDICDLKNSVDQQVWNIKQKLEDERKSFPTRKRGSLSCASDSELYSKLLDEERNTGLGLMEDELFGENHFSGIKPLNNSLKPGKNNIMIQQMSSDIDILKGTLDLAFGRMQNAEVFPLEKQWRWSIEKDTVIVSIKGFISDVGQNLKAEFEQKDCSFPVGFCREKWTELINDIKALQDELKDLCSQSKVEEKKDDTGELSAPPSSIQRATSEPLPEVFFNNPEKDSDASGSLVAKMVKSHESFIQKQREREEWNWLAREFLRRKGSSSVKRDKDPDELESKIQKAIRGLENLIKWDDNLGDDKGFFYKTNILGASVIKFDRVATEKMNAGSIAELSDEISKLEQERDGLRLQASIIGEFYNIIFGGFIKSLNSELLNYNNESLVSDGSSSLSTNDVEDDHGVATADHFHNEKAGELEDETASSILQYYPESSIREDLYAVYFKETIMGWNMNMECSAHDCLVKEEICRIVFSESMQCIEHSCNLVINQLQKEIEGFETLLVNLPCSSMLPETVGSLLKEDVYNVYLKEHLNAWRTERDSCEIEMLIKEDIYQFVMVELVKEANVTVKQSETSEQMKLFKDLPSPSKLDIPAEEHLVEKPDSSLWYHKNDGMVSKGSQTKEHSALCNKLPEHETVELLITDEERSLSTASERLETSVHQFFTRKSLALDMEHNSGMTLEVLKEDEHRNPRNPLESERQDACFLPEDKEVLQKIPSVFSPFMRFQKVLEDFQHMAEKNLELQFFRVDKLKHQINALAQPAATLRIKKLLYKKAFITRCHNLQLAENEVDLLGNQVEKLLCLLQNIYIILRQNSTVLSQYFGVFDILRLIKKELVEGAACTP